MMPTSVNSVTEHRHHAGREELVQRVDVGGDAGHEAAHRIPVVKPHVQLLQID